MVVRFIVFLWLGLLMGCRPTDNPLPLSNPLPSGCSEDRSVVDRVKGVSGIVSYHLSITQLTISYALLSTINSQWTRVVCNLPKAYRLIGKPITFSGEFRDAGGTLKPLFGGQEMYYLYLTAIQSR